MTPGKTQGVTPSIRLALGCGVILAVTASLHPSPGHTEIPPAAVPQLLEQRLCHGCHALTEPRIGPPYTMIAARHAADKDVMVEVLAQKIRYGGAGNWGVVPMVGNEDIPLEEARAMSRWILNLD